MNDTNDPSDCTAAAKRRASWPRLRMHRIGGRHLSTVELIADLKIRAEQRKAERRLAICQLMDLNGVRNTVAAHAAAIERLWTPRVYDALGFPPNPSTLVRWRKLAASGAIKPSSLMSVRCLRCGSN